MPEDKRSSPVVLRWKIAAYAVLAALAWLTLTDWRMRGMVWVVMLALAAKTWVDYKRARMPD